MRRYNYHNQPTVIWWNLVRLAEDLAELIASGDRCDDPTFTEQGFSQSELEALVKRAENQIQLSGDEYKSVFKEEYTTTMCARLGLSSVLSEDLESIITPTLDLLATLELDFNNFFRRLSKIPVLSLDMEGEWLEASQAFLLQGERYGAHDYSRAREMIADWVGGNYRARLLIELEQRGGSGVGDAERIEKMLKVNPNFIPRSWMLQEVIDEVEKKKNRTILQGVMKMVADPYKESWGWNEELEKKYCADPPKPERGLQCSCSS